MSLKERGLFFLFLCKDWEEDGFEADLIRTMLSADGIRGDELERMVTIISECFIPDPIKAGAITSTHSVLFLDKAGEVK